MKPLFFPTDSQFWFETLRVFGHTAYGGADVGEVMITADRIVAGDYESWYREWLATAERVEGLAKASLERGHRVSARDAFLRASNYFRSAEFFLHGAEEDPRAGVVYERQVACYRAAAALFDPPIEAVTIPYEGTVLHGYFHRAPGEGRRPTVLMHSGFDGTCEEMHFYGAAAAVERGYHVLAFDGPGQPAARHRDGLVFRPDWEKAVTPAVDWLMRRPEVDANAIGLMGISMGGLLAPRAAAFEHRLAACIAVDGVFDLGTVSTERLPMPRPQAEALLRAETAPEIDAAMDGMMADDPRARWAIHHGMHVMGVKTPRAFLASYLDYDLTGVVEQVQCPTLVCEADDDIFFAGQPKRLFDALRCPKTFLHLTDADGAGAHCHGGAQRLAFAHIYDWLDEVLRKA
jgi:dienelactone hydrolase